MDWHKEFADFGDVAYLNVSTQGPVPLAAARAAQVAIDWKKSPHTIPQETYFGLPDSIRALVARLINAAPEEIAVTTGASGGLLAVAQAIAWQPGDEILVAQGEFPAHLATWMPLAERDALCVKIVKPAGRFLSAGDLIAQLTPRTRLVSVSLVRFDDASLLDAPRLAAACRRSGACLLLDVSQCAGAMPLDVHALGADFLVCAGYKWLLSPYGTGFFWVRGGLMDQLRAGPLYWKAVEGAADFHSLPLSGMKPARGARRWDSPETASFFNLAAMKASLEFVLRVGVENIWHHNAALVHQMIERLPRDRCILASPADAAARGPFVCFAARSAGKTQALFDKLKAENVIVALRENAIRVAPHLYNTPRDIDRLISVISV
ncbi:MAG: aminotransferase class V-fold PLP-dependent enzyme [Acidobacteria bacterium]|nr:aminotransferase class V-fold PLP-dependent enzyme [Acidobacteriota bacterium]MBI3664450.1 aminotransferase class V-fold PLP-dependent enzyme [Acidobacteriota bacterium]